MYFLYSVAVAIGFGLMLPALGYLSLINKNRLPNLRERLGNLPDRLRPDGRPTIWIHACSVGEAISAQPLASALAERFPYARLVFSVITRSGRAIAEKRFAKFGAGCVFYFPVDHPACVSSVLNHLRPQMLICVDTEIWPNTLRECRRHGISVFLVNGRISERSFRRYRLLHALLAPVLANYTMIMMKSDLDAERIRLIGAKPSRVRVTGNMKYDQETESCEHSAALRCSLGKSLGLADSTAPLIVAGSTHEGEEEALLAAFAVVRRNPALAATRLLIAPRHAERFDSVAELARKTGERVVRRSDGRSEPEASVLLLDTTGELSTAYWFATVAFVGGTLNRFGGHSIAEPALYGKAIVIGPSMENFADMLDEFREQRAIRMITAGPGNPDEQRAQLAEGFTDLLTNEASRTEMGRRALSILEACQGATKRTVEEIGRVFAKVAR